MTTQRVPRNTEREAREHPIIFLAEAMAAGSGAAAIEAQESQGQQSFVNSETLPTDLPPRDKAILEAAGVKFLGPINGDPLFQYVELPTGWKKVATDHSMWSNLVDHQGRKRASIFYKAASYDRAAHMGVNRRYSADHDYQAERSNVAVSHVKDGDQIIFTSTSVKLPPDITDSRERYLERRALTEQALTEAQTWLQEHFPNWKDPGAYWD